METPFRVLLVTSIAQVYERLIVAVRRRYPDATTTHIQSGRMRTATDFGVGFVIAMLPPGDDLARLVGEIQADAVLSVTLGATAAPDAAAVGDVLVPAMVHRVGQQCLRVSTSVLDTARGLARERWATQLDERRPGRDDEQPSVRFGDAIAVDPMMDRPFVRASGFGIVMTDAAESGAQLSPDVAFGLVVGISDDASVERSGAWKEYASATVCEFAVALAGALRPAPIVQGSLLPQRELLPGMQLYRAQRAGQHPLGSAQPPIFFSATAVAALAEVLLADGGSWPTQPRARADDLCLLRFTLGSPLHVADLTAPSARFVGIDISSAWRLDERGVQMVLDAGLDGWVLPARLSADPAWDHISVMRADSLAIQTEDIRPVTSALEALDPHDPVAQLLIAAVSRS